VCLGCEAFFSDLPVAHVVLTSFFETISTVVALFLINRTACELVTTKLQLHNPVSPTRCYFVDEQLTKKIRCHSIDGAHSFVGQDSGAPRERSPPV
jgi:hypothetical protein